MPTTAPEKKTRHRDRYEGKRKDYKSEDKVMSDEELKTCREDEKRTSPREDVDEKLVFYDEEKSSSAITVYIYIYISVSIHGYIR